MYAFITGASSGIGQQMALLLAEKGYNLILVARRTDRLESFQKELHEIYHGRKILIESCDLSIPKNCVQLFDKYQKYPITIVINNAGFGKVGSFTKLPLEEDLKMMNTNMTAIHILTKLFCRSMKKGRILNVSSMAAFQPGPILTTYSACKSYVFSLSMAVNYELKRQHKNIHITTLCPGPVDTEFNSVAGADMALASISAKQCAKQAIDGLFQNKSLVIPSLSMKALHMITKWTPYSIILAAEYKIQTKKLNF